MKIQPLPSMPQKPSPSTNTPPPSPKKTQGSKPTRSIKRSKKKLFNCLKSGRVLNTNKLGHIKVVTSLSLKESTYPSSTLVESGKKFDIQMPWKKAHIHRKPYSRTVSTYMDAYTEPNQFPSKETTCPNCGQSHSSRDCPKANQPQCGNSCTVGHLSYSFNCLARKDIPPKKSEDIAPIRPNVDKTNKHSPPTIEIEKQTGRPGRPTKLCPT